MNIELPEISIVIVAYNSKKYLDSCLTSIKHQTIYDSNKIEVIFIDNGSFDGSISEIQRNYKWVSTVRNLKNVGFAAALNMGIHYASGDYILLMNHDVILERDYLEKALKKMKQDKHIAALTGKIYQYDFNHSGKTAIFDTVGVFAMVDREILSARGSRDIGQFEDPREIFSVRNICGFYRKRALEDVRINDEYFDENFFLYLEDVDLCWRLHLYGWKVYFLPSMVAHHCMDNIKKKNIVAYKKREKRYFMVNERFMVWKNEFIGNMLRDVFILLRKRFIKRSILFSGWISGWIEYLKKLPSSLKKRRIIMKKKRISNVEIRRWFIGKGSGKYNLYKSKSLEIYAKYPPIY